MRRPYDSRSDTVPVAANSLLRCQQFERVRSALTDYEMEMEQGDSRAADCIEARRSDRSSLAVIPPCRTRVVGRFWNRPTRASALLTIVTVPDPLSVLIGGPRAPMMTASQHHGWSGAEIMSDPVGLEPHHRGGRVGARSGRGRRVG